MSESAAAAPDLDEIADELYALRPEEFAAARDERIRTAKAAKQQPLARELARLRKPTQSAWLVNFLWRHERHAMEQLLELGGALGQAQAKGSGPELLRLTAQRREVEAALLRAARALAEQAGVTVSASLEREVQETLGAALAQPEVADEVRTGRLVKPAAYAGFGTFLPTAPAARRSDTGEPTPIRPARERHEPADADARAARPAEQARPAEAAPADQADKADQEEQAAEAEERERRQDAERQISAARAALDVATGAVAERVQAADTAHKRLQALRKQVEQVQRQLHDLEAEAAVAERTAASTKGRLEQAEKVRDAAQRTLDLAEEALA